MPLSDAVPLPKTPPLMTPVACHTHSYLSPPCYSHCSHTGLLTVQTKFIPTSGPFYPLTLVPGKPFFLMFACLVFSLFFGFMLRFSLLRIPFAELPV